MPRPTEVSKILKETDPAISAYVNELEKENLKLQKRIAKLQVQVTSRVTKLKH